MALSEFLLISILRSIIKIMLLYIFFETGVTKGGLFSVIVNNAMFFLISTRTFSPSGEGEIYIEIHFIYPFAIA